MTRVARALCTLSPRAILGVGLAIFLLYAFPGYMSTDSVVQLLEARSGQFSDPHPPIMAALWRVLDAIISGPILMLLTQAALFLSGGAALLRRCMAPRAAAVVAVLLLVFPPVITTMAVIWKDAQMAGYLLAGTALLLSERRGLRSLGVALVTVGCALRYNAFGAAVPLVFTLFEWRPGLRWFQRYAISLVMSIVVVAAAFGVNRALTVVPVPMSPAVADIVGVLSYTDERSDDDLRVVLRDTPLRVTEDIQMKARQVFSVRNLFWIDHGDTPMFDRASTEVQTQALDRARRELIASDWNAYLSYRRAMFVELLGITDDEPFSPAYNQFLESAAQMPATEHNASWARLQFKLAHAYLWLALNTPLFQAYFYAAIALLLLVFLCRDRLTFALLGSGLTYELSYFPAASTPDVRYSHWLVVCTCLGAVLLFAQRRRARRAA